MFSGPIPTNLGILLRLEYLYLHFNQLSGDIPMSLGQLSKLKSLDLSHNSFVGELSETHFTKLRKLNFLSFSSNSLALSVRSRWIPSFQLQVFYASSCNIGPHFPNWLQTQTNLKRIDLFNSSIKDTIPEWFENISSCILHLDLSNNQIGGKLPRVQFDTIDQMDDGILKLNSNRFEGSVATIPSNVKVLDLSDNLLSGNVPQVDGTMAPTLVILNLSRNKFSGTVPKCLANLIYLIALDLSNNTITGVVPSSLASLQDLYSLHLQNNKLEGDILPSLQNLTTLGTLDLGNNCFSGTIPFWIGEKLSNLEILNLESNKFTGKIPSQFCQLNALYYLSLAHNNITGTIPHCFRNLSGMITNSYVERSMGNYEENIVTYIKGMKLLYTKTIKFLMSLDLSNNKIVGEIPDALMYLVGLKNLNLSGNLLKGHIPMSIGDLTQLESLDLFMNKLSGRIPQSLTKLHFLSYLNLSFNNLSGPIPIGNQLQTLRDVSIYEGNNGLCGPQVSRSCNGKAVTNNNVSDDEGQDDTVEVWFYVGMGQGFVVGFMGLFGSLHFIRSWRLAYFGSLENVYGWLKIFILLNLARLRRKVFE